MGGVKVFGILLIMISVITLIGATLYWGYVDYQYERDIGSYFANAEDCIAPDCMLSNLQKGRAAMITAGLTSDLYGRMIFTKPDNKMEYQYQHLDAIIERAQAVYDWKAAGNNTEALGDVYNQKVNNVRNYISEGGIRSDWIAKDTWVIKYHPVYYVTTDIFAGLATIGIILGAIFVFANND